MVCLHGKVIVMILSFKDALVAITMNIRNKVSCNIECFKNFLLLSSIPLTISGTQLKEAGYSKIYKF